MEDGAITSNNAAGVDANAAGGDNTAMETITAAGDYASERSPSA